MSLATIRTALQTKLDAISGVENVYGYQYWTEDWQTIYDNFAKDGRINCWFIGLANRSPKQVSSGTVSKTRTFNLYAYYSFKSADQTSIIFENLLDSVCNEFEDSLSFTTSTIVDSVSLETIDTTLFAGTPAHRGQIQIVLTETTAQDLACSG
jgi:hypothetical protein